MEEHYFPFSEDAAIPWAGSFNFAIPQEHGKHEVHSFDFTTTDHGGDCAGPLPSNYHLAKEFAEWALPISQWDYSGSDFTTSPASTATLGRFPLQDGQNPFDTSFGGDVYSKTQNHLIDVSSSQDTVHTSFTTWTPAALEFPAPIHPNLIEFHSPQPRRGNAEVRTGNSFQNGYVEQLEQRAISLPALPKRRRKSEPSDEPKSLISSEIDSSLRYNTSQAGDSAQSESPLYHKVSPSTISALPSKFQDLSKDSAVKDKDRRSRKVFNKEKERHKHVEMKYRKQMKDRFEKLLLALPCHVVDTDGKCGVVFQKKVRRGKVLDLAKEHIDMLQRQECHLLSEQLLLQQKMKVYEDAWFKRMGVQNMLPWN